MNAIRLHPERAIPLITVQVADITDEAEFPEFAAARARLAEIVGNDVGLIEGRVL